ncbi:MAG: GNAT family N-acetyltransferase [Firmicutes bacterium]|nr:GNAT family N-acetyltransferase [Bacillota bacterium]
MEIVEALACHLEEMVRITDEAKVQLKNIGTDQWQQGYPNKDVWEKDIEEKTALVAVEEGKVCGAFAFLTVDEESYRVIEGSWLTDTPYASVHRFCVSDHVKGTGVAGQMFKAAFDKARDMGFKSVRIDTHPGNFPMQKALKKAGFIYCGDIYLVGGNEDGAKRLAYEYVL